MRVGLRLLGAVGHVRRHQQHGGPALQQAAQVRRGLLNAVLMHPGVGVDHVQIAPLRSRAQGLRNEGPFRLQLAQQQ